MAQGFVPDAPSGRQIAKPVQADLCVLFEGISDRPAWPAGQEESGMVSGEIFRMTIRRRRKGWTLTMIS
jgi:hypothetical protein